jgi:hypothetical protein
VIQGADRQTSKVLELPFNGCDRLKCLGQLSHLLNRDLSRASDVRIKSIRGFALPSPKRLRTGRPKTFSADLSASFNFTELGMLTWVKSVQEASI